MLNLDSHRWLYGCISIPCGDTTYYTVDCCSAYHYHDHFFIADSCDTSPRSIPRSGLMSKNPRNPYRLSVTTIRTLKHQHINLYPDRLITLPLYPLRYITTFAQCGNGIKARGNDRICPESEDVAKTIERERRKKRYGAWVWNPGGCFQRFCTFRGTIQALARPREPPCHGPRELKKRSIIAILFLFDAQHLYGVF